MMVISCFISGGPSSFRKKNLLCFLVDQGHLI